MTTEQEKLVEENLRMVDFVIRRKFPRWREIGEYEDVQQTGRIGLCKAAQTYDSGKGQFSTYAAKCIRNELKMALRGVYALSREGEDRQLSIDAVLGDDDFTLADIVPDPGADTERQAEVREKLQKLMAAFEDEPILFAVATKQMTQAEAAELLGISQPHVNRRIKSILRHMLKKEDKHDQDQHERGSQLP